MTHRYDYDRYQRIGLPEAVLCQGKSNDHLAGVVEEMLGRVDVPVLFTRMSPEQHRYLADRFGEVLDFDAGSGTAYLHGGMTARAGSVAIVTAGTSDLRVADEARRTLEFLGVAPKSYVDVGVAGLWRLHERIEEISEAQVVIVVAGMDAALASVVGGLVAAPVIGVPTSTGYGVAHGGQTALNSMLTSCAQGVLVTNIDNGFGAACAAVRILGPRGS